jgi:hypothetical protein
MNRYRLHIDMPLGTDEQTAIRHSNLIIGMFNDRMGALRQMGIENFNVRLGNDTDRQKSNYLDKDENGHVSNKKLVINT